MGCTIWASSRGGAEERSVKPALGLSKGPHNRSAVAKDAIRKEACGLALRPPGVTGFGYASRKEPCHNFAPSLSRSLGRRGAAAPRRPAPSARRCRSSTPPSISATTRPSGFRRRSCRHSGEGGVKAGAGVELGRRRHPRALRAAPGLVLPSLRPYRRRGEIRSWVDDRR